MRIATRLSGLLVSVLALSACAFASGCAEPPAAEAKGESNQAVAATALTEIPAYAVHVLMVQCGLVEGVSLDAEGLINVSQALDAKDPEAATRAFIKAGRKAGVLMDWLEREFPDIKFVVRNSAKPLSATELAGLSKKLAVVQNLLIKMTPKAFAKALPGAVQPVATLTMKTLALFDAFDAAATRVASKLLAAGGKSLGLSFTAAEMTAGAAQLLSRANLAATVGWIVYETTRFAVEKSGLDVFIADCLVGDSIEAPATWQSISNDEYGLAREKWNGLHAWLEDTDATAKPWQGRATSIARSYFKIKHIEQANRPPQTETTSLEAFIGFLSNPALNDPNDPSGLAVEGARIMDELAQAHDVDWSEAAGAAIAAEKPES